MDIHNFPLYYISFQKKPELENHYKNNGFSNINHFKAVRGKDLNPTELIKDKIISVRSYDDLMSSRREHSGLSSMGAVGCALSHYGLWNICVENNYPYMIIVEDDNRMYRKLASNTVQKIKDIISKPSSIFVSVHVKNQDHRRHFFGLHFYIISNEACRKLIKDFFPIDVQVDWYIANQATLGNITVEGFPVSKQTTPPGKSTIQTDVCITCMLPKKPLFYIGVIIFLIILLILSYVYRKKWQVCESSCSRSKLED